MIEALSLAAARLDEPAVRGAYHMLTRLVDAQLGGSLLSDDRDTALTEPQRVLIAYGLKHLRAADSPALVRSVDHLLRVLSGEAPTAETTAVRGDDEEEDAPVATAAGRSRPLTAPPAAPVQHIEQHLGVVTGGVVNMVGIQNDHRVIAPPTTLPEVPVEPDEDTSEMRAVQPPSQTVIASDVFISYSRRNAEIMRRVRADLRSKGLTVWTDDNLQPGTPSWKRAVEAAIRGARCMVVIMTPDSKESEWVEREINTARDVGVPIFPLLARGNRKSAIPFVLNSYQYADIRHEGDYRTAMLKFIEAIRSHLRS